ncbi:RING finger protein [Ruminococcus sp. HUN007]|uniref:RING finger protein n=1 Tax=Ruminococcus sp. HUN007 TaxID=1514668 RepID=UPI0005D1CB63|nr:RING finger protein [Ruminococcus sp. HUN007]
MISYTGEECIVCRKKFEDGDDIVACPVCGTPYHRSCYMEKNECINYALHETGGSWMAEAVQKKKEENIIKTICPECSVLNDQNAEKCINCGTVLKGRECEKIDFSNDKVTFTQVDITEKYYGMDPHEVMDEDSGVTIGDMADYVGFNRLYYMLAFRRLKFSDIKMSVNLSAFLFPEYYCAARKMFVPGMLIMLFRTLIAIPFYINLLADGSMPGLEYYGLARYAAAHAFTDGMLSLTRAVDIALKVCFGLFANELYFRYSLTVLKRLRKVSPTHLKYKQLAGQCGGISIVGIITMLLIQFLLVSLILLVMTLLAQYS